MEDIIIVDRVKYLIHKESGTLDRFRGDLVGQLLGRKYTLNDQIALLRQKDDKPDEYAKFTAYADSCVDAVDEAFAKIEATLPVEVTEFDVVED